MPARIQPRLDGAYVLTFPYDPSLISAIKAHIPAHYRSYDPDRKAWTIHPPYTTDAAALIGRAYPDVEYVGADTAPPRQATGSTDTYAVLHLLPTAPPELVESAYRCLSRLHHPDAGGTTTTMQRINAAASTIRKRGA